MGGNGDIFSPSSRGLADSEQRRYRKRKEEEEEEEEEEEGGRRKRRRRGHLRSLVGTGRQENY